MIILGIVLIVLGLLVPTLHILFWVGVALVLIGCVLALAASAGHGRLWY